MKKRNKDDRIAALRDDPDFRALVDSLRDQTPERIEAFLDGIDDENGENPEKTVDEHTESG